MTTDDLVQRMVERSKATISEMFAPAIDPRAPYAKVMTEMAVRAALLAALEEMRDDQVFSREMMKIAEDALHAPENRHGLVLQAVFQAMVGHLIERLKA